MAMLHPTLWRTCRVLSGGTRLALLRAVIDSPDHTVTELAHQLGLSLPRASQELRRLQSRGLIQAHRSNQHVLYRPEPDPLVSTAAPLLHAMRETFAHYAAAEDNLAIRAATGFSHVRRLVLVRRLQQQSMSASMLEHTAGMSRDAVNRHIGILQNAGVARRIGRKIELVAPAHPLARCLLEILADTPVPDAPATP